MNANHQARLGRLEQRVDASGDHTILFERVEADDGTLEGYRVLNTGRVYTPEAFDRLVEKREDAVFVTLQSTELAAAANKAYWEEHDANMPTWDELLMENAEAKRVRETGDVFNPACSPRTQRMGIGWHAADTEAADAGTGDAGDEKDGGEEEDGDAWVEDVTIDSDRATLARYHVWLMEQSEPWRDEMGRRKAKLDAGRRV